MEQLLASPSYPKNRLSSEVWALTVSLFCLFRLGMSAPTGKPLWVDPCGGSPGPSGPQQEQDLSASSSVESRELLEKIRIAAEQALDSANKFSEEYVRKTFQNEFKNHHRLWSSFRYDWLPLLPKQLGEPTPKGHLDQLGKLDKSLLKSYSFLQTIAVGLEQVHHDKKRYGEDFLDHFEKVMYKLRQVLCEVHSTLSELNTTVEIIDIQRSVMDNGLRDLEDGTERDLRDWLIFRDFMNCLQYLIDLCKYFQESSSAQVS